jgi:hypothetical protein
MRRHVCDMVPNIGEYVLGQTATINCDSLSRLAITRTFGMHAGSINPLIPLCVRCIDVGLSVIVCPEHSQLRCHTLVPLPSLPRAHSGSGSTAPNRKSKTRSSHLPAVGARRHSFCNRGRILGAKSLYEWAGSKQTLGQGFDKRAPRIAAPHRDAS